MDNITGNHNIRASDTDANSYWGGYLDGTAYQPNGVNLDFTHGHGEVNVERGNPADGGFAEFQQIYEYHDSNGWTFTDDLALRFDNDPDYHPSVDANEHHVTVVHD